MDPKGALRRKGSDSSDAVLTDSETEQCTTSKDEGSKSAADVFDVASTTFDTFACVKNPLNRLVEPPARATKAQGHDSLAVSVYDCLDHFMAEEALLVADGNGLNCEACCTRRVSSPSVKDGGGGEEPRQDARKRLLMLGSPPGVLVCHLKRLQTTRKTCQRVEFDLDLDMSPYFWQDSQVRGQEMKRIFGVCVCILLRGEEKLTVSFFCFICPYTEYFGGSGAGQVLEKRVTDFSLLVNIFERRNPQLFDGAVFCIWCLTITVRMRYSRLRCSISANLTEAMYNFSSSGRTIPCVQL